MVEDPSPLRCSVSLHQPAGVYDLSNGWSVVERAARSLWWLQELLGSSAVPLGPAG